MSKIYKLEEFATWKPSGKIVTTNGCFDLLHYGHIYCLQEAKKMGDFLIVGVNSDRSVTFLKEPGKPLNSEYYRAMQVASLECVDAVVIFDNTTPEGMLEIIQPAIHVKGGDYVAGHLVEYEVVTRHGGEVRIVPTLKPRVTLAKVKCYQ